MLRIRLTRTGKKGQPSFRVVVAEKSKAVKRKYLELLGHYLPAVTPKKVELNKERIEYWISKGAQPTDTVAALLKRNGFEGMEKFMEPRNKKKKKKGEQEEEVKAEAKTETSEGSSPEEKKEEVKAEATPPAEEKKEEAPAEEAKKEEAAK